MTVLVGGDVGRMGQSKLQSVRCRHQRVNKKHAVSLL